MTPGEKTLRARLAAHASWSKTSDPSARTKPGRDKFQQRFENEVDPDRVLSSAERQRRAEAARKAYFTRLALKSAQARRNEKSPSNEEGPIPTRRPATESNRLAKERENFHEISRTAS